MTHAPLTIALSKGNLYEETTRRMHAANVDLPSQPGRRLQFSLQNGALELLILRPMDVPAYVEYGAADCGIVGKDTLWETDSSVAELADLGFGTCKLVVAGRAVDGYHTGKRFPTFLRVATKFKRTARQYFAKRNIPCDIIELHGSVELGPLVGLSDVIVDLVSTGGTLAAHDMVILAEIDTSSARFVANPVSFRAKHDRMFSLLRLLEQPNAV